MTYTTPLVPDWEIIVTEPLPGVEEDPFVGEGIEYVAENGTPEIGPVVSPISSVPVRLPVGLAPSPANSPEKMVAFDVAGVLANPA